MNKSVAFELGKMRSLIERMEGRFTPYQAILNEERLINEAMTEAGGPRQLFNSSRDMFNKLDSIIGYDPKDPDRAKNDTKLLITMGYVSDAKLNTVVKRKNPLTNRMKTYTDYSQFGDEVAGIVCVTYYNYNYMHRSYVKYDYGTRFVGQRNALRIKYGIPLPKPKPGFDEMGNPTGEPREYRPKDEQLVDQFGDDYNPQNLCSVLSKTRLFYPIDINGHTIKGIDDKALCFKENEIKNFLAADDPVEGVNALKKLNAQQHVIDQYAEEFNSLKMIYKNFRANSILSISATDRDDGGKFIFINPNVDKLVDEIQVDPKDLYDIAYSRYEKDIKAYEAQNAI